MGVEIKNSVLDQSAVISTGQKSLELDINKKNHEKKESKTKSLKKPEIKVKNQEEMTVHLSKKKTIQKDQVEPKNEIQIERDFMKLLKIC